MEEGESWLLSFEFHTPTTFTHTKWMSSFAGERWGLGGSVGKGTVAKTDDLSSTPGTWMVEGRKKQTPKTCLSRGCCAMACECMHKHAHTKQKTKTILGWGDDSSGAKYSLQGQIPRHPCKCWVGVALWFHPGADKELSCRLARLHCWNLGLIERPCLND